MSNDFHWLVTCSCGWGRECISAWSAQASAKLHQRLGELDVKHSLRIEPPEPPRGAHWLLETKGQESAEVSRKDEAARRWCADASALTGVRWVYLKVP